MKVLPEGADRYRLTSDDGRELGWIRGRAVRFFGFASGDSVMETAQRAWRALLSVLRADIFARRGDAANSPTLRLERDDEYDWISDGRIPLARMRRPRSNTGRDASFDIELVVPVNAHERLALRAARAIADATRPPQANASDNACLPPFIP
jgi:hypothetical protein